MDDREAKSIIESVLFLSGEPLNVDNLKKLLDLDKINTERLARELLNEYTLRNSGILIVEVAGGFQMVTNPACSPWVKKILSTSVPKRLSQSSLETLAIIAYKQPIIKAEIEAIRGVNSDGVVKTLLERRLIKILGRKEAPGRPLMYGTTREFLQQFGLRDLSELPTLKEFEEVDIPELPETLPESAAVETSENAVNEFQGTTEEGPVATGEDAAVVNDSSDPEETAEADREENL